MDKIKDIEQFREKRPKSKADPVEFHGGNSKAGTARSPKSCISSKLKGERKEYFPLTFELSPFSYNVYCTCIV